MFKTLAMSGPCPSSKLSEDDEERADKYLINRNLGPKGFLNFSDFPKNLLSSSHSWLLYILIEHFGVLKASETVRPCSLHTAQLLSSLLSSPSKSHDASPLISSNVVLSHSVPSEFNFFFKEGHKEFLLNRYNIWFQGNTGEVIKFEWSKIRQLGFKS